MLTDDAAIHDDGAFILPTSDVPDPALVGLDGFLYAAKSGFGVRGAHIAGTPDLAPSLRRRHDDLLDQRHDPEHEVECHLTTDFRSFVIQVMGSSSIISQ